MIRMIPVSLAFAVATTLVAAAASSAAVKPVIQPAQPAQLTSSAQSAQPGDQSRWSLDFQARMEQSSSSPIEIHMTGGWTSTISAVRPGEYDSQLQLTNLQFAGDAVKGAPAASVTALQTRLSRPFWATYRNDGGLLAMHFFRDVSTSDRNLLEMITTELQLVRPEAVQQSWTAQERDGAGEYSALYLAPQADRILKRKLKYNYTDGVAGAPEDAVRISVDNSDITFSIAADHRVEAVDGSDRVRISLSSDKSGQLAAVTEFHASHLQTGRAPELVDSLAKASADVVDLPIVTQRPNASQARAESDDRLLRGYTTEAVLDSAFAIDPANRASASNPSQPDRLTALLRRRPEAAPEAAALLIKNGPRKIMTNALGAAASPSAVVALSELAHNTALAESLRVDAILAFVQMQHPTAEAMHVPADLLTASSNSDSSNSDHRSAVRSAARLISGALSRAGRTEHPAEADAIDATLLALYQDSRETSEKTELLGALGNSAGPAAIPAIENALRDSSASVRSAAARALRLAGGADVDRLLATAMVNDSDAAVRADAIFATRFRHPLSSTLIDALLQTAGADQSTYVRSDALAVLRQNVAVSPRISETLTHIAESDANTAIRRQAQDALAALSNTASIHP